MIHININMPKSCEECCFRNETYDTCPLIPNVPALQAEIQKCKDERADFCPLMEGLNHE